MSCSFKGAGDTLFAYEAGLESSKLDAVLISQALGQSAVGSLRALGSIEDPTERVDRFNEILGNDLPMEAAGDLIAEWGRENLSPELIVHPRPEGVVNFHSDPAPAHIDDWAFGYEDSGEWPEEVMPYVFGPFSLSVGTGGIGMVHAVRYPRKVPASEILTGASVGMKEFRAATISDTKRVIGSTTRLPMRLGDLLLVPVADRPSAHSIEVPGGMLRTSVTGGYVITRASHSPPDELRRIAVDLAARESAANTFRTRRLLGIQ